VLRRGHPLGRGRRELMPAGALPGRPRCPRRRVPASGDVNRAIGRSTCGHHAARRTENMRRHQRGRRRLFSPKGARSCRPLYELRAATRESPGQIDALGGTLAEAVANRSEGPTCR
jgi:hypothetical protein